MAKTANYHDKSQEMRQVRIKRDIDPLSSIFDKESKAHSINKSCRHSCTTANKKRTSEQAEVETLPPTKRRTRENEQKTEAAFDPGNEILDEGKGKKNMHEQFINTTETATSTKQTPEQIDKHETTGLLPGLAPPILQGTGEQVKGNDRSRHRKENKAKRRLQQSRQRNDTYWTTHKGEVQLTDVTTDRPHYRNSMCPTGLALEHPAAATLQEYANTDAHQKWEETGRKTKYGRQSNAGRTSRHYQQKR